MMKSFGQFLNLCQIQVIIAGWTSTDVAQMLGESSQHFLHCPTQVHWFSIIAPTSFRNFSIYSVLGNLQYTHIDSLAWSKKNLEGNTFIW